MEEILESLDYELLTYLAKKTRVDSGRIIDDVRQKLSLGTISNIENRKGKISYKTLSQYFTCLSLSKETIVQKIHHIKKEIQDLTFQLELVQVILDERNIEKAKIILDNIQIEEFHPLAARIKYLYGRLFYVEKDFKQAQDLFFEVIECYEKNNYFQPNYLIECFNSLSTSFYYQEDIPNALKYVNLGFQHYAESESNQDLKYLLTVNKVLYLIAMGQRELAFELIQQIWGQIREVEPVNVKLNFYKFRAQLLKHAKQFQEAISCAEEGIQIARKYKDRNRSFGLLIVLGTIYTDIEDFEKAKTCFQTVEQFEDMKYPRRFVDAHVYLGIIHSKQEEWKKAEYHLSIAQQFGEKYFIDVRRLVKLLIVYGNIMMNQKKYEQALSYFEIAYKKAINKSLTDFQHDVLFHKLKCLQETGKMDEFHQVNIEFFQIQEKLYQREEMNTYESAGYSFTINRVGGGD
ncbi:tetratricopeptide repeat protein [Baia soyae]|uniref:Tetratricopeptide repeat protein n=1 Tax=Baia soyae TaxID=1544746 RepID=A0A4V6NRM0_9BACL|nr:hypothetical protein [Baia soyae]TCP62566.1 hypothetical protein EDD57_1532 [Baia soyae]